MKIQLALILLFLLPCLGAQETHREIKISKNYLNLPVQTSSTRQKMVFKSPGKDDYEFVIRLSNEKPDYWVFTDVSELKGKTLVINYPEKVKGLDEIYQSDQKAGADSFYREANRPQFHFTTQRGWINDPNGLVYFNGEYHLYYQHNPFEKDWSNMHWGHAVSRDLIHWTELPEALYPDKLGTMFSGSAVVDVNNTAQFQKGPEKTLVIVYTADRPGREVQCIAYSNDKGRSFTKFDKNPVIDSHDKWNTGDTRDPKVFWHKESNKWVMILFERTGHSVYHSADLKTWTFQSHINGFWECPELFELPVDNNMSNKKWVMYGASGTYLIGTFDGKTFTPESDKLCYYRGSMYAAQTYTNIPETDGRRIQIGWGQIEHPHMPFNGMMTFPTELTLRTTRDGIRLYSEPIKEIAKLFGKGYSWKNITVADANEKLKTVKGNFFHIKMKVELTKGTECKFMLNGNALVEYDMNKNTLNGEYYGGDHIEDLTFEYELLIDKTSVEVFADKGKFSLISALPAAKNSNGFEFGGGEINIKEVEIHEMNSIWK